MSVDPVFYTAARNHFAKFHSKGPVYGTPFEFLGHQFKRRDMMGGYNDVPGFAYSDGFFNKTAAFLMFDIETLRVQTILSVPYPFEVTDAPFCQVFFKRMDESP